MDKRVAGSSNGGKSNRLVRPKAAYGIERPAAYSRSAWVRASSTATASGSSLTDIFGVGPIIAAMLIGNSGSMSRFANRDRYAAYNGTAPAEFSSGGRTVHRVSQCGNRTLNHALHLAAMIQLRQRHSEGRAYYERRVAEGKTGNEAVRALERPLSNIVHRHLAADNIAWTRCRRLMIPGSWVRSPPALPRHQVR